MSDDILFEISNGRTYESEYDGRNDRYCSFCDCNLSDDQPHDSDCLMLEARKALGPKRQAKFLEAEKQKGFMNCPRCNQSVRKVGLKQHQNDSARCMGFTRSF